MNKIPQKSQFTIILVLGLLTTIGPFSIDLYLPAFPQIAKGLQTDVASVMLSLSSFFVGISIGQLIYGPLLERYGRKKPLYVGLGIYIVSSAVCAMAVSVEYLILFRLFQALGSCSGMVASRAIVRDLFPPEKIAKVFSSLMLVIAVSPIIAPTVGGLIAMYLGWRYIFVFLIVIITIILALVIWVLPESKEPDPSVSFKPKAMLNGYKAVLKNKQFALYAFTSAVAYSGLYAYISGSPFVFLEMYQVTEKEYGWIFGIIAAGLIGASQVNNLMLKKYSSEQIIKVSLGVQSFVGVLMIVFSLMGWINEFSLVLLLIVFLACQGFNFPNTSALSMAPFSKNAGNASALMGFMQMTVGALMSAMVSFLHNGTVFPMVGVMAFCAITASFILYFGKVRIQKKATEALIAEEDVDMISNF